MSSTSFLKKLRNGFLSILFGILLAGIIGEIVVRVFNIESTYRMEYYKGHVARYRPGISFTNHKERTQDIEINSLGYYDREREKSNSNYRLLMIGDSFLEGKQVPKDSLFSVQLEDRFRRAGCTNVEVINAGMAGFGTAAEYVAWRDYHSPEIDHDEVILQVYMGNDLKNNNKALNNGGSNKSIFCNAAGEIEMIDRPDGRMKSMLKGLRNYSALVNLVYTRLALLKRGKTDEDVAAEGNADAAPPEITPADSAKWRNAVEGTLKVIENWNAEVKTAGKPFRVFVINKSRKQFINRYDQEFMDRLRIMGDSMQFSVKILDMGNDPYQHFSWDQKMIGHFNFEGHSETAKQLFDWLHPKIQEKCQAKGMARK